MTEAQQRQTVIAEALTWVKTPFRHEGRVKGVGVDCGMLLLEVYNRAGVISHLEVEHYSAQWMFHRTEEKYLKIIADLGGHPVQAPGPGDIAIWRPPKAKTFSHSAIVIAWPRIVHALADAKYVLVDDAARFKDCPVRFYSPWGMP